MLRELYIRNFAIIDDLRIQFDEKLNILTGETGAGKSIIIEALGLLLGERADADFIRTGQHQAIVEGLFDCENYKDISSKLEESGIEIEENQLIIKRVVSSSGRNKIYINGSLSSLAALKDIGNNLIDIHGQHQHQALLNPESHIDFFDSYAKLFSLRDKCRELHSKFKKKQAELDSLIKNERENLQKKDLYEFQMKEIDDANLKETEEDDLRKEKVILQNAEKLHHVSDRAYDDLYSSENPIVGRLNTIFEELSSAAAFDESIKKILDEAKPSLFMLEEAATALRDYSDKIEISPEKLNEVEDRLAEINELKRKYGATVKEILEYRKKSEDQFNAVAHSKETIEKLTGEIDLIKEALGEVAVDLAQKREKAISKFVTVMEKELHQLNMDGVNFKVNIDYKKDENSFIKFRNMPVSFSERGIGALEFLISPNQGELPKPMVKIASGGELSRIMLSFKNILATQDTVPIVVFDEVDSGIGGRVAETVGVKLKGISQSKQVFCITHLPQIASLQGSHYRIEKEVIEGRTITKIRKLNESQRVDEIARMSGGETISQVTREHAKEMLSIHP